MHRTSSFESALYHRTWRRVLAVRIAMLGMAGAIPGIAATPPVSALALEGQLAPGMGGATFTSFDEPVPKYVRRRGLFGRRFGRRYGRLRATRRHPRLGGALRQEASGNTFVDVRRPGMNNSGTIAFAARGITGTASAAVLQKTTGGSSRWFRCAGRILCLRTYF
jgi:hypothetical protein